MGAPERGNDLDARQDEIRTGEDGDRVEPFQTRFAEYVDLLVIDREVCRDSVPTPPWVATSESNGVSSDQVGVGGAAPDDQEHCAWNRAEPDPGSSSFATIGSYRAVVTNPMGWAVRVRSGADQRHHGSGNTWEVTRIVRPKVYWNSAARTGPGERSNSRSGPSGEVIPRIGRSPDRVAGQEGQIPGHQIAHVAADELTVHDPSCRHVGGVVHRYPVVIGDTDRALEECGIGADKPAIVAHRGDATPKSMCRRAVVPRMDCHVGDLVEGQIQGGQGIGALEQAASVLMMDVIRVLARQQDACVE